VDELDHGHPPRRVGGPGKRARTNCEVAEAFRVEDRSEAVESRPATCLISVQGPLDGGERKLDGRRLGLLQAERRCRLQLRLSAQEDGPEGSDYQQRGTAGE
jgi:hypothetical protein